MSVYHGANNARDYLSKSSMWLGRPSSYAPNGSGRDSYIANDNGGLYRPYEPAFNPDTGTFGSKSRIRNTHATIDAKHSNYTSNGGGRDGYIR